MSLLQRSRWPARAVVLLATALVAGCSDDDPGPSQPTPAIGLTLSSPTIAVVPGQSQTVTATVARTNFTGAVAIAVTGAPAGLSATVNPASLTGTTASSTITLAAGATTAPGTYQLTVSATGTGVTTQSATLAVTVAAPPSASIAVSPAAVSGAQGGTAAVTVTVTRAGGFAGPVEVTAENLPANVTVSPTPLTIAAGATTGTLNVAFAANAAAGAGNITLRARGTGITDATTTLPITVTAPAGNYTIALNPATVSVAQGATTTPALEITRTGGFNGAVGIAVSGAPAGLTVTPAATSVTGNSVALNVAASATVAVGSYPITVTTSATGLANQTATLTVNVTPAVAVGNYTLALDPAAVTLQQGATATSTLNIARTGGFAGAVALTVSGAPAGLTVTPAAASVTGNSTTLAVAAAASVAPGTYQVTVRGASTGLQDQTATLAVTVTAAPTTGGVGVTFCQDAPPLWVGYQAAEGGAWTRATLNANGTASLPLTGPRSGVAYVVQAGTGFSINVFYGSPAELTTFGASLCQVGAGGKTVTGTVTGLGQLQSATITLGSAATSASGAQGSGAFTLTNVPAGPRDLLATRATISLTGGITIDRGLIRRNLTVANGGTLAPIDFASAESFAPATANVTIANAGGDLAFPIVSYVTANGSGGAFFTGLTGLLGGTPSATQQYAGVPADRQATGDFHLLAVAAMPGTATNPDATNLRTAGLFFRTVADRTVTLGPQLTAPTVSLASTTPYPRPRVQLTRQAEYGDAVTATFTQAGATPRSASITALSSFAGGGNWDLTFPDLTGAAGFDPTWALRPGTAITWAVSASGGNISTIAGGQPTEGATVRSGTRTGSLNALRASRAARLR